MKNKVRINKLLRVVAILMSLSVLGSCVIFNGLFVLTCDLDQQIRSTHLVHPETPDVNAVIDFAPSYCYECKAFITIGRCKGSL